VHDDRFVLVHHGTIEPNYGLDVIVRAVALLTDKIPGLRFEVYGGGTHRPAVEALAKELGLEDRVQFSGWLLHEELLHRLADADAGVVAVRRDAFRDVTLCIKMFDLISMRRPVVISRTRAVEAYFGTDCFQLFESGNEEDLARAIYELYADPDLRRRLVQRATAVNEPYRWVHQGRRYVEVAERLMAGVPIEAQLPAGHVGEPVRVPDGGVIAADDVAGACGGVVPPLVARARDAVAPELHVVALEGEEGDARIGAALDVR
jgi:glycosyltransferase involved in cell wall biosynthesis